MEGNGSERERVLCGAELRAFERYLREQERSAATVGKYLHDVRCFADFVGDGAVGRQIVLDYKAWLGERYAVASANSMLAALNCFLRFCGQHALCVKQFRVQRQAYCSADKELTRTEYLRLLEAANEKRNGRLHLILQTVCGTGIRVSELRYITVEALRHGEATVHCKGKSRRVFLVPELRKKLLRYAEEQGLRSGPVFITRGGRPIGRQAIWREMKGLCARARVAPGKVFPHNLRHLFARTFYSLERDIAKLADILGHASINTTRIYIVTTGEEHRRKLELMRLVV